MAGGISPERAGDAPKVSSALVRDPHIVTRYQYDSGHNVDLRENLPGQAILAQPDPETIRAQMDLGESVLRGLTPEQIAAARTVIVQSGLKMEFAGGLPDDHPDFNTVISKVSSNS